MNAPGRQRQSPPAPAYLSLKKQLVRLLGTGGKGRSLRAAVVFLALVPVAFAGFYGYRSAEREMTGTVLIKREDISHLVASVLAEKLDRLMDVSVSLSTP